MIAINTKYIPPSNFRGSRIAASTCNGHRLVISMPIDKDGESAHRVAAEALALKMGWTRWPLIAGGTKDGYAFVFNDTVTV